MVCRLCLNESFNLIEIFGEQGTKMEIPSILSTHFWFELKIDDPVSTSICSRCWHNTENFHVFYLNVKEAQNMLERSSAIGLSDEVIIKTECTEDDTPNVSLPGSSFFDQNNTRVNATTKSGFVQETVTGYTDKYMKNIPATSTSNFDSTLTEELILKSEHEEYDERGDSFDVDNRYDYLPQSEDDKMTVDPMLNDSKNAKRPQKKPNTNKEPSDMEPMVQEILANQATLNSKFSVVQSDLEKRKKYVQEAESRQAASNKLMRETNSLVKQIFKKINRAYVDIQEFETSIDSLFPLESLEELNDLEVKIQDQDFSSKLILYLKHRKGIQSLDCLFRSLARDRVYFDFNVDGRLGKRSLLGLTFFKRILFDVCRDTLGWPSYEKELRRAIFLSHNRYNKAKKNLFMCNDSKNQFI